MCSPHSGHEASRVHHLPSGTASLHACCFPRTWFSLGHVLFWIKKHLSPPSLLFWLPPLSQSGSTVWCMVASPLIKCSAHLPANNWANLDPFKEADRSLISLSLITLMIQLMVGVPRVTGTWDPKTAESGKLELLDLCHSPKLLPPETLWWYNPRARIILLQNH